MKKKKNLNGAYDWKYTSVGGMVRVDIRNGADIAHLGELDQKLWTVLSCPVNGLEFDKDSLKMLETGAFPAGTTVFVQMNSPTAALAEDAGYEVVYLWP